MVTPANRVIAIPPMSASVRFAFAIFWVRKAGTPLATASTPVRALHPLANERSSSNTIPTRVNSSAFTS